MNDIDSSAVKIVFDSTISDRKILIVPIKTIEHTPYNPSSRTKEGAKLSQLIDSIRKYGAIYPILITADRNVIDGNRRLAACRALGHDFIECVISDLDRDEAFTTMNTTINAIGGKGWLEIARGGGYLPKKEKQQYDELSGLVGSYGVDLLVRQNLGLNVLTLCKAVKNLGVRNKIEELILLTASKRLTNKLNAELRADKSTERKVTAIHRLLKGAA